MASTKRAFESVKRLRNLNPQVLRDFLVLFPGYVKEQGLTLPEVAKEETLGYGAIHQACIGRDIPAELDDILFLSSVLGRTGHGWDLVKQEPRARKVKLDAGAPDWTYVDLAIRAAIKEWPKNRELLEHANARAGGRQVVLHVLCAVTGPALSPTSAPTRVGSNRHQNTSPRSSFGKA